MQIFSGKQCTSRVMSQRPLYTGTSHKNNVENDFYMESLQAKVQRSGDGG